MAHGHGSATGRIKSEGEMFFFFWLVGVKCLTEGECRTKEEKE